MSSKYTIALVISNNVDDRLIATKRSDISVELLCYLSDDSDKWVKHNVAQNKKTPINILKKLSLNSESFVRLGVLHNFNTPNWLLSEMLDSTRNDTNHNLETIALNPNITGEIAAKVYYKTIVSNNVLHGPYSKGNGKNVYTALLKNSMTPANIISEIYKSRQYQ